MKRVWVLTAVLVVVVLTVTSLAGLVLLSASEAAFGGEAVRTGSSGPTSDAVPAAGAHLDANAGVADAAAAVPGRMLQLYVQAAATCAGLPWQVLAGIGTEESDNGRSDAPGVRSGANAAGAEGPMQFEPATFAEFDLPVPPGGVDPPSPYDPTDAVYAAARLLCADGAGHPAGVGQAVYAYNHSASYVAAVLTVARSYGWP